MALTKHQKLARGLRALLTRLYEHHQKTANILNALQFHFYEDHLIAGRPAITESASKAMMKTHRCWLKLYSLNEALRIAAQSAPLIGMIFTPRLYPVSKTRLGETIITPHQYWVIPWGVKIALPSVSLCSLDRAMREALLYCASTNEMSEWVDWFEHEDKAATLVNQLLTIAQHAEVNDSNEDLFDKDAVHNGRWKTSLATDRETYAWFIQRFATRFLQDPLKNAVDGEIALLLWVMIYASLEPDRKLSIKRLLILTTVHLSDRILSFDKQEVELSCGLADLFQEYMGKTPLHRQQKLFPHLTIDKLEDRFHQFSKELLPPGSIPILPEAFLTFPHPYKHLRISPHLRRQQLKQPPPVLNDLISRQELKRQLLEKAKKTP